MEYELGVFSNKDKENMISLLSCESYVRCNRKADFLNKRTMKGGRNNFLNVGSKFTR